MKCPLQAFHLTSDDHFIFFLNMYLFCFEKSGTSSPVVTETKQFIIITAIFFKKAETHFIIMKLSKSYKLKYQQRKTITSSQMHDSNKDNWARMPQNIE